MCQPKNISGKNIAVLRKRQKPEISQRALAEKMQLLNVNVDYYSGLLIDYAKQNNLHIAIRGLRAVTDFEYELQIAQTNKELSNGSLDTVFLTTSLEYSYLSSSAVKEIAAFNGDISKFVTPEVCKLLKEKYKR